MEEPLPLQKAGRRPNRQSEVPFPLPVGAPGSRLARVMPKPSKTFHPLGDNFRLSPAWAPGAPVGIIYWRVRHGSRQLSYMADPIHRLNFTAISHQKDKLFSGSTPTQDRRGSLATGGRGAPCGMGYGRFLYGSWYLSSRQIFIPLNSPIYKDPQNLTASPNECPPGLPARRRHKINTTDKEQKK
jgi:hypothetical protein